MEESIKPKKIDQPRNPAENYRKTLFNYDLEIANTISRAEFFAAREEMYRNDKSPEGKKLYFGAVVNLRKLEQYLIALKKGKNDAWSKLEKIVVKYKPKRRKIWYMYFISGYTSTEISEMLPYDLRNLKRMLKAMREEMIFYLPYLEKEDDESK